MNNFKVGEYVRVTDSSSSRYGQRGPITELGAYHCRVRFGYADDGIVAVATLTKIDIEAVLKANAHLGLIEQIKGFRAATGAALKESKDAVEAFRAPRQTLGHILKQAQEIRQSPTTNRTTVQVRQQVKHWIIAVLDKKTDMPLPATNPRTYSSAAQARRVAFEMAEKNRSETFVVYEATDVVVAPPVTLPETQHVKL